jgi:hypothetical protein
MKKVIIISISFLLFFAVLAYFIWQQYRENQNIIRAQTPQTTSQPLPPAPPDTGMITSPDFTFARLKGDSLHLYSLPVKSDSTLEAVLYKDELDKDHIELLAKKGDWYQNEDSLWLQKNEIIVYSDSMNSPKR